jgi:hypothetical protein
MGFFDYFLIAAILTAASYLLYRSFTKGKCHCDGCSISSCAGKKDEKNRDLSCHDKSML